MNVTGDGAMIEQHQVLEHVDPAPGVLEVALEEMSASLDEAQHELAIARSLLNAADEDLADLQDEVTALAVKYLATGMWAEHEHALAYIAGCLEAWSDPRPQTEFILARIYRDRLDREHPGWDKGTQHER